MVVDAFLVWDVSRRREEGAGRGDQRGGESSGWNGTAGRRVEGGEGRIAGVGKRDGVG